MKTSIRMLAAWIVVAASLSAATTTAGSLERTSAILIGAATAAQADSSATDSRDQRQEASDLLRRARQAMAEGDLAAAESLISAAETLDVSYGLLHVGDTPKKARHDLERQRDASDASATLATRFLPRLSLKNAQPVDPFSLNSGDSSAAAPSSSNSIPEILGRARNSEEPAVLDGSYGEDPPVSRVANPVRPVAAAARAQVPAPLGDSADARLPGGNPVRLSLVPAGASGADLAPGARAVEAGSEDLLLGARRALALGDTRQATELVNRAKQRRVSYGPLDDTPEKVETAIRQYQEVAAESSGTEGHRRNRVRMLMGQAEALLRYNDYQWAEELALRASQETVTYSPFEARPQDLLDRIAAARQDGHSAPSAAPGIAAVESSDRSESLSIAKNQAVELSRAARAALEAGHLDRAESLARQADLLGVPDSAYAPGEEVPGLVLLDVRRASLRDQSQVVRAGGRLVNPATGTMPADSTASQALYDPSNDPTRNVRASHQALQIPETTERQDLAQDLTAPPLPEAVPRGEPLYPQAAPIAESGSELFARGEAALKVHDTQAAYDYYRRAAEHVDQLDPLTRQRLQERLQLFSAPGADAAGAGSAGSLVDQTAAQQQALARQVSADVAHQAAAARSLLESDPTASLAMMDDARKAVEMAGLEPAVREQLLRLVDRHLADMQQFIQQNRARLELDEGNRQVLDRVDRELQLKLETQDKLAQLVDDYNTKMQEQRYAEAEVIAKRAVDLAPNELVAQQLLTQAKLIRRHFSNLALQAAKEEGFWAQLNSVDLASVGIDDNRPYTFPDAKTWEELSAIRSKFLREQGRTRSEGEQDIERKLRTPVSLGFAGTPLSEVLDHLAKLAEVNLYLDPQGLAAEGVTSNTPVTIQVRREIMLKSALNLILQPLHLSYVIKDEVLKITSEDLRDGEVYRVAYNVADLVVPIPNFVPGDSGLAAAYHKAMGNVGFGGPSGMAAPPLAVMASKDGNRGTAAINPGLLAQVAAPGQPLTGMGNMPAGYGPGGLGGGSSADFDSLIDLITATIDPASWDVAGGPGSIAPFDTNLSIVVSTTQEIHEQIVDLLEQLRRMQDLQVTIEVRFITLNDNFFERLGVDFDFDINDGIDRPFQVFGRADPAAETTYTTDFTANTGPARDVMDRDNRGDSVTVGLGLPDIFSADLDIPFRQGSFQLAVPQFGGFAADAGAQIGFAILSDIEAFFFINAAQGDRRSNVLQAPKVTLFNGQQAMVQDSSQSPFVTSVIPIVGDFAAAQQPVIMVLSEGTYMTVQAVVSNDRRFIRLTVVPVFSKIGEVKTFQFTGSETTTTSTSAEGIQDEPNDGSKNSNASTVTREGTTVQQPSYSTFTVTTTVSVPDGGTVLLGGIKRLSEGRNEFGVPMLAKLPYINRLFKNVGIGRETQSLMMMVTPRIIIQEEEETAQTGFTAP